MKVAFSICSNNYWPQVKVLFQSLRVTNPDYKLILGLADKKRPELDYSVDNKNIVDVVEIAELKMSDEFIRKHNIIELCTAVKASYMKWIKATFNADMILYFDPDIKVFSSLAYIEGELEKYAVVLTPHIYKPISEDEFFPPEKLFLQYGIYNLGFIGISFINNEVFDFLEWWEERLMKHCFIDIRNGLFVDQLPITFVTVFFSTISKVLFHYGLNVAPWNLHEREISMRNSEYYSNGDKLVFFHFSNICFSDGKHPVYNRYEVYPVLEQLFEQYRQELLDNSFHELKSLKPYYRLRPIEEGLFRRIGKFIMRHIRKQT